MINIYRMIIRTSSVWVIVMMAVLGCCQEWFMVDSHLISEEEFKAKIVEDDSTYKVVKFFTPNCVYCRYLKMAIDKIKKEKEWSFQIYDFNCAWYPKFCNQQIQASAFPFTAIYNQHGQEEYQMVGYYPENVILEVFQKVEQANLDLKKQNKQTPKQQVTVTAQQPSTNLKKHQEKVQVTAQESLKLQQSKDILRESESVEHGSPSHLEGAYQHLFFAICILLGVVYFGSFLHLIRPSLKDNPHSDNPEALPFVKVAQ